MACSCSSNSLSCCTCCEGLSQETPLVVDNRPGLSAVAYRVGTYNQFRDTLYARISLSRQPMLDLRTRDSSDFTIALLDAFSVMGDVLTFYSERIQNESWLRTATERFSVRQLANLVGYRMSPGVAAAAYLAFTIDPTAGAYGTALTANINAQVVPELVPSTLVPVGTRVQSIPGPGETPQTFETIQQISARPEWNAMTPRLLQPQQPGPSVTALILTGTTSNLKNGDRLLILTATPPTQGKSTVVTVLSATPSADGLTTQVNLPPPPPQYAPSTFSDNPAASLTQGNLKTLQAAPDIPTAAAMLSNATSGLWWDAGDIVAAALSNQWPLDVLNNNVDQLTSAQSASSGGSVYAFRQTAAPFGYNAPIYSSLPAALRYGSVEETQVSPPTYVADPAAYPKSWEPFTLDQWGTDAHGNSLLYLDTSYPQIVPGSYIWIQGDGNSSTPPPAPVLATVVSNTVINHSDFSVSGKVSQLAIQLVWGSLSAFGLRTTSILCQSESLALAQVPITGTLGTSAPATVITLDSAYLGLLAGQTIIVSGQTSVNSVPGPVAAETAMLQQVQLVAGFTVITLSTSLTNVYIRSTVKINANVAQATHGQTITEVLGNGDGTQTFQTFILHQSPLTYVPSATGALTQSTLKVYVDNILWTEVPFLYGHGPGERIYVTSQDDAGVTTIMFGDGVTGLRLPTGVANVQATYRYGIGAQGNVRANQLSLLTSRPLGVRGVNNPLNAAGGADPEDLNTGRGQATLAIQTLGRVVSLEDYQDFALAQPGIGKALATWTWNGQQRVIVLTIGGVSGPIAQNDPILTNLPSVIASDSEPGVSLFPFAYTAIYFNLNANVLASPDYQVPIVQSAIMTALRSAFGYSSRNFGQPVFQSEVITAIQNVPGVVEVTLTLYLSSDLSQTPLSQIPASVPQTGGRNSISPAQLLTIDPGPLNITVTQ